MKLDQFTKIDEANWSFLAYSIGEYLGMITMSSVGHTEYYAVNIFTSDFRPKFQKNFSTLVLAMEHLNTNYSIFPLKDLRIQGTGEGCESCANHH